MNVRRHARIAQGSDKNGIKVARQHLETVRRNSRPIDKVAIGSPVKRGELQWRTRRLQHLERQGNYFFTDAISGHHGDSLVIGHELER